jgi:hypothetical protein
MTNSLTESKPNTRSCCCLSTKEELRARILDLEERCGDLVVAEIITGILKDERISELERMLKALQPSNKE